MQIAIIAFGTRGDVQPALALAKVLKSRGLRVRLLASAIFKSWVEGHGIEFLPSATDIQELMQSKHGLDWVEHGRSPRVQNRVMKALIEQVGASMGIETLNACAGCDAVISSFTSDVCVASVAEKLNIAHISIRFQPSLIATRSGAATMNAPRPNHESFWNKFFGKHILETAYWRWYGEPINRFRVDTLKLPAQKPENLKAALARATIIHAFSKLVVPTPCDWPNNLHTFGYWFLDEGAGWSEPPELKKFFSDGEQPVFIGFGSMTGRHPEKLNAVMRETAERSGKRIVLHSGWAGLGEREPLHKNIFVLKSAPFDKLFPRFAAIVHHGGAGTTGEALRSGVPQVIVPCFGDQPFWARRCEALGVSPPPVPRHRLTAKRLTAAIHEACNNKTLHQKALQVAKQIRNEDGLAKAATQVIETLSQHLKYRHPSAESGDKSHVVRG